MKWHGYSRVSNQMNPSGAVIGSFEFSAKAFHEFRAVSSLISSTACFILATPPKHFPASRSLSRHADPRAVTSSKREWRSLVCRIVNSYPEPNVATAAAVRRSRSSLGPIPHAPDTVMHGGYNSCGRWLITIWATLVDFNYGPGQSREESCDQEGAIS